ncbi:DUF2849 domain-containing protein, partial [Bradyrhizobium uaiense]
MRDDVANDEDDGTANRTWDGAVVYRTAKQGWSTELAYSAVVSTSDDARALLAEA